MRITTKLQSVYLPQPVLHFDVALQHGPQLFWPRKTVTLRFAGVLKHPPHFLLHEREIQRLHFALTVDATAPAPSAAQSVANINFFIPKLLF